MTNQHTALGRMAIRDIHRLKEIQAFVDNTNVAGQRERIVVYQADFAYLQNREDYKTADRLFRCIGPIIDEAQRTFRQDTSIINVAARMRSNYIGVLYRLQRLDEFTVSLKKFLAELPGVTAYREDLKNNSLSNAFNFMKLYVEKNKFNEGKKIFDILVPYVGSVPWLNQNLQWALGVEMQYHWNRSDWRGVIVLCKRQLALSPDPRQRSSVQSNIAGAYCNWSNGFLNEGNWPKAREVLKECEKDSLPSNNCCAQSLRQLEAEHRF
jgi:hypothetical protein